MGVICNGKVRKIGGSYYVLIEKEIRDILEKQGINLANVKAVTYELKQVITPQRVIEVGDINREGSKVRPSIPSPIL